MKNVNLLVCVIVVALCLGSSQTLATIYYDDGLTHDIDYAIDDYVYVDYQTPYIYTIVNLLPGGNINHPYSLKGYEQSRINICGGTIGDELIVYGGTQVDISNGSVGHALNARDSSQVKVSGGSIGEYLIAYDSTQIEISSGSIGYCLTALESSQVKISGGFIENLHADGTTQVDIFGGTIGNKLFSYGFSQINILGGFVGNEWTVADDGILRLWGSDFFVDGQSVGYTELESIFGGSCVNEPWRRLTGTLLSGELIDNDFHIGHDARIVLIPEPASAVLMIVGATILSLHRRKK